MPKLCETMSQRQYNAGQDMKVKFEAGAARFEIQLQKSKEDLAEQFDHSKYDKKEKARAKSNIWATKDAAHEDFMDDMLDELNDINDIAVAQKDAFGTHMRDLETQSKLVEETKGRVKVMTKRAKDVEKKI